MSSTAKTGRADVVVVGAGLAGLAAANALAGAGARVTLLDRKPYVGGRAYSYVHPALAEEIDSQHVMLGCCTNLVDLCRKAGADQHIRWWDRITFLEPGRAGQPVRASEIGAGSLPAPSHSTASFLRAPMLELGDKVAIARGLMEFLRGYPAADDEPFSVWLTRTGQTERAVRHFWEPVVVGALNDTFERCSTRYAGQVFHESFLRNPEGGRLGIPTLPLSSFYADFARLAERNGAEVRLRTGVDALERTTNEGWRVRLSSGEVLRCEQVVLALPFEQAAKLLATLRPTPAVSEVCEGLQHFVHAPITTVHVWFESSVTTMDHAALLDTRIQWMFNKTMIRAGEPEAAKGPGQYLELTISASHAELQQSRDEILSAALDELALFFPKVREVPLVKSGVLKEARATFSVLPGLDRYRPANRVEDGLFLAGDWTRTGWPSTMEGAVRSGRLAAEAIAAESGGRQQFVTPDLPATGLMRWLAQ